MGENQGLKGFSALLQVRKAVKLRKPSFKVQKSNDPKKRFPGRWKRPKGLHSKIREQRRGRPLGVEPGYGSPKLVKGATSEGLFPIFVRNIADLDKVKEGMGAVVSATVGMKKKAGIIKAAVENKLKLININPDEFAKRITELVDRKKKRREMLQKKKAKAGVKKQPAKTESDGIGKDIEGKLSEEDRKKAEKAEKDKVLTKPQ